MYEVFGIGPRDVSAPLTVHGLGGSFGISWNRPSAVWLFNQSKAVCTAPFSPNHLIYKTLTQYIWRRHASTVWILKFLIILVHFHWYSWTLNKNHQKSFRPQAILRHSCYLSRSFRISGLSSVSHSSCFASFGFEPKKPTDPSCEDDGKRWGWSSTAIWRMGISNHSNLTKMRNGWAI